MLDAGWQWVRLEKLAALRLMFSLMVLIGTASVHAWVLQAGDEVVYLREGHEQYLRNTNDKRQPPWQVGGVGTCIVWLVVCARECGNTHFTFPALMARCTVGRRTRGCFLLLTACCHAALLPPGGGPRGRHAARGALPGGGCGLRNLGRRP